MQTARVVLSDGTEREAGQPRPATLFVSVPLGHSFRALPVEEQRRAIEDGLTDALALALDKLEALHAPDETVAA